MTLLCLDLNIGQMAYNKNEKVELTITDMTKEGLGISKISGQVFFVKDAIIGDKVVANITKVTKNIIYAKTIEILKESKLRVKPICDIANACGGCQLLCLNVIEQLKLKYAYVTQCLKNIGKFDTNKDILADGLSFHIDPKYFRNKMQVPFAKSNGEIIYGFYAGRTHHIVRFDKCPVGFKNAELILNAIKNSLIKKDISIYDEKTNKGIFREVMLRIGNVSKEVSITYIINDSKYQNNLELYKKFDAEVRKNVENSIFDVRNDDKYGQSHFNIVTSTLNINTNHNNVLFGNTNIVLFGNGYIEDSIGDIKYHISPESFYQVNMEMTKDIYDKVVKFGEFTGNENVLDLYCGIGTISLYISKYVKSVLGIEIVERAIRDAKENAKINNITNANFICADVDTLLNDEKIETELTAFDTIIVDPPRKGLDKNAIDLIKRISPNKIIYVSCDPATLARDLDMLCHDMDDTDKNAIKYNLKTIANVDMFPHTMHMETIALILKEK